ncbi:hypothetical protein C8R43DRAFT_965004 [Mycena crocata]|nr:hypothetical protein C8R43DRAFT_965004 [Mycena crocata]
MSSYKVIRGAIVTEIERPQWKAPLPDLRDDDFASFTPPPGTSLQTALPATTVLALHNHQIMGKGLFEFALLLTTEPYLASSFDATHAHASPSPACSHDTSEAHPTPVPPAPSIAGPNPSSSAADRDTEASSTPRHVQPSLVPVLLFDDTGRHMSVEEDNIDDGQEENTDGIQQKTTPTPPTGPVRWPLAPLSLQTSDFNIAGAAHFSFLAPFNVHSRVRSAPAQFSKL